MALTASPFRPDPYVVEPSRLAALKGSDLLSDEFEASLDRWTRLAAELIGAPMALLSLIDADRHFFKSHVGLPAELAARREIPLTHSFCRHVVADRAPLVVTDARDHPRVRDNPAVAELGVLAYAGRPVSISDGHTLGALCVVDTQPRAWSQDELALLEDLTAGLLTELDLRAALRAAARLEQELTRLARVDALTELPNRRQLADDLAAVVRTGDEAILAVYDLDGFKLYNDTFGHPAGDALLVRLAHRLSAAVDGRASAYRLGGDEFCVLAPDRAAVELAAEALREHGDGFAIGNSFGCAPLGGCGATPERALQLADERLYEHKHTRCGPARRQAHDVLLSVLREREPELDAHVHEVAALSRAVAEQLGLDADAIDETSRAAQMHDIGKVAIPDEILHKPGPLDESEWALMRRHTLLGERILSAAPALRGVGTIVRATHERWDGRGYPDGLAGEAIPLGARIVFVCDAFHAMTTTRPYGHNRSVEEALTELHSEAGRQFDRRVVAAFSAVIR